MKKKMINTNEEAIECLKKNKPTNGYIMLQESVDMAITALEKQIPIKVSGNRYGTGKCPICDEAQEDSWWAFGGIHYCSNCGQAMNWD